MVRLAFMLTTIRRLWITEDREDSLAPYLYPTDRCA
jgi:hypothetical protein